ncbi:MAG TPA: hypothetical protein VI461_17495 [Chitinophagaceae bacterium]|nr:hypothetical protein [Chitinophagaceae bacterium]
MKESVDQIVREIQKAFPLHNSGRVFTVAISGIDASGKSHITKLIQAGLEARGFNVANINIDPWQNPLPVRLQKEDAAENFYNNVFRWKDFFDQLIIPLQRDKQIHLETKLIRTDADEFYPFIYRYDNLDILLIEGIFLFQQKYLEYYDYKIWIDCSFETGLQRAINRNTEKLDKQTLIHDYHTFYYPAQRLHFRLDDPKKLADMVFDNN